MSLKKKKKVSIGEEDTLIGDDYSHMTFFSVLNAFTVAISSQSFKNNHFGDIVTLALFKNHTFGVEKKKIDTGFR